MWVTTAQLDSFIQTPPFMCFLTHPNPVTGLRYKEGQETISVVGNIGRVERGLCVRVDHFLNLPKCQVTQALVDHKSAFI